MNLYELACRVMHSGLNGKKTCKQQKESCAHIAEFRPTTTQITIKQSKMRKVTLTSVLALHHDIVLQRQSQSVSV